MTNNTISEAVTKSGGEGALLANRYRIIKLLGHGGMGAVWLAEDTQLDNKPFAIKMLPSVLVSNSRAYRQLKDEALVAMKLTHSSIVTLRAFEENNGNPFLVMDYIDGRTLDDYLAEHCGTTGTTGVSPVGMEGRSSFANGRDARSPSAADGHSTVSPGLSESEVVRILKPIAAALDYAHGEGVVHRDVKPANVMIRKDGHPFILDFGISREVQETLTRVTGKLSSGTLLYMSPEQLNGAPPKKEQDVYSFAAMVYECIKGAPPFSRGQIEYQILNSQPQPLPLGCALSEFIMAGLAKDPAERPQTCMDVLGLADAVGAANRIDAMHMLSAIGADADLEYTNGDEALSEDDKRLVEALCAKLRKRGVLPSWIDEGELYDMSDRVVAGLIDRIAREWMRESCRRGVKRYVPLFTRNDWSRWSVRAQNGEISTKVEVAIYEFVRDDDILSKAR